MSQHALASPLRAVSEVLRADVSGDYGVWVHPEWERRFPWVAQGITARATAPGSGGAGGPAGDAPPSPIHPADFALFREGAPTAPASRWTGLAGALGFSTAVHARQVHEARILIHGRQEKGLLVGPDADGHATASPGVLMAVTVADCVPVYLVDPKRRAVALVHAGWRGAAAGILEEAVGHLGRAFGSDPGSLSLHLGPSICGECYEVGPEVHRALGLPDPGGPELLDLREALTQRARRVGVRPEEVTRSTFCTRCGDSPFFSHRGGDVERQVGFLGIRPTPGAGLCERCVWARTVQNRRGSRFLLCRRSEEDASFPRYPRLPVLECRGFEKVG